MIAAIVAGFFYLEELKKQQQSGIAAQIIVHQSYTNIRIENALKEPMQVQCIAVKDMASLWTKTLAAGAHEITTDAFEHIFYIFQNETKIAYIISNTSGASLYSLHLEDSGK